MLEKCSTPLPSYLTDQQRRRIDELCAVRGVSLAQIVRDAVDLYLERATTDPAMALAATLGADPDVDTPNRDEWDRG